jgi:hypothetical protein
MKELSLSNKIMNVKCWIIFSRPLLKPRLIPVILRVGCGCIVDIHNWDNQHIDDDEGRMKAEARKSGMQPAHVMLKPSQKRRSGISGSGITMTH